MPAAKNTILASSNVRIMPILDVGLLAKIVEIILCYFVRPPPGKYVVTVVMGLLDWYDAGLTKMELMLRPCV